MNSFSKSWDDRFFYHEAVLVNAFHEKGFGSRCYAYTFILLYPVMVTFDGDLSPVMHHHQRCSAEYDVQVSGYVKSSFTELFE